MRIALAVLCVALSACVARAPGAIGPTEAPGLEPTPEPTATPKADVGPPTVPMSVGWRYAMRHLEIFPFAPMESASPVVVTANGSTSGEPARAARIITATARGQGVYSLDPRSGAAQWTYRTRARVESTPAVGGGRVYIADAKGRLHGVDLETGKKLWDSVLGDVTTSRLLYDGEGSPARVVVATTDNRVQAVDAASGGEVWTYRRDVPSDLTIYGTSTPVKASIAGTSAYIVGFSDGHVVALRAENGTPIWETRLVTAGRFRDVDGSVAVQGDRIWVIAYQDSLFSLDATSGKIRWSEAPGGTTGITLADGKLLHGTDTGDLIARDPADGRELWRWHLPAGVPTTPVVAGENVFVASSSRTLYALRLVNGSLTWTFDPGHRVSGSWAAPVVSGSRLYFTSNVGTVYCFVPSAPEFHYIGTWDSGARR